MPFCNVKGHLLTCKRASFTTQKGTFYEPLCNLLILRRLQTQFFTIILRFAINTPLLFVMLFLIPHITLPSCLSILPSCLFHPSPVLPLLSSSPFPSPLSRFDGYEYITAPSIRSTSNDMPRLFKVCFVNVIFYDHKT